MLLAVGLPLTVAAAGCNDPRIPLDQYLAQKNMPPTTAPSPGTETATSQPSMADMQPWSPGPYRVGPGDVLGITVTGLDKLGLPASHQVRVSEKGEILLPMVRRVQVGGLTLDQIEPQIQAQYVPKYIKDTDVTAQVVSYEPVTVMVMGDTLRSGGMSGGASKVEMRRNKASVLQALLDAGGAQDYGGRVTVIPARAPDEPASYNLTNRADLVKAARLGSVEDGDIMMVDSRPNDAIYVQGLVNQPGAIPMPRTATLTILQAIGAAGGTMLAFEPREATLMRHKADGALVSIKVDLDRVKDGRDPDMVLAAGDLLIVPHNTATRLEEYIARSFSLRIGTGIDTNYNPWTMYYLKKGNELSTGGNNFFNSLTNQLQTGAITPLVNQAVAPK